MAKKYDYTDLEHWGEEENKVDKMFSDEMSMATHLDTIRDILSKPSKLKDELDSIGDGIIAKEKWTKYPSDYHWVSNTKNLIDQTATSQELTMKDVDMAAEKEKNSPFSLDQIVKIGKMKGWVANYNKIILHFLSSADPRYEVEENNLKYIITGGCFTSHLQGQIINDIDVFILDDDYTKKYIMNALNYTPSASLKYGDTRYMHNEDILKTVLHKHLKIQFIFTKYKTREALMDHFDLEHTCVSYDHQIDKLYISKLTYDCIMAKELLPHKNNDVTEYRMDKFTKLGWGKYKSKPENNTLDILKKYKWTDNGYVMRDTISLDQDGNLYDSGSLAALKKPESNEDEIDDSEFK